MDSVAAAPQGSDAAPAPQRKRLVLKPRSEDEAKRLEAERQAHLNKANPFGAAKPREAVIAQKTGKTEEEVLKEEVSKEKLHLRLSGAQLEEKRQAEAAIEEIKEVMGLEEAGSAKHAELATELAGRQQKLDDLMEEFAKVTLETALSGGAPRVSQIRQQQQLAGEGGMGGGYGSGRIPGQPYPAGGSSFGGRDFNEPAYGGRGGAGAGTPAGGGGRGFPGYQQRGGFADSYQSGERQGRGGGYGGGRGNKARLPEWAMDDASDTGFYDAPAATSAFIASGGYQGGGGGGRDGGRGGRGGGRGQRSYGNGGYGAGSFGRGPGGEFEYREEESSFGAGQDRF